MHSHLCGFRCVDADAKNLYCLRHWIGCEIRYIRPLKETEEEGDEEGEEETEVEGEEEKGEARS